MMRAKKSNENSLKRKIEINQQQIENKSAQVFRAVETWSGKREGG